MSQAVNRIALCPPGWPCSSRFPACVLFVLALALCLQAVHLTSLSGSGPKTYFIHWNMSNSVFRIDNTDHIFDINKGNSRFEYDQMNIICPVYAHGTRDEDTEKYIIYNVSKEEYDTCRITNPNPRIIAVCDKPFKLMYFTITFRPFTPQPGGLEFLPGHDYYFISTSSRDDLHRRIGGRCTTHNMKVVFKVWYPHDMDQPTTSKPGPITTEPWPKWPPQDTASPVPPIRDGPPAGPSTALVETAPVSTTQKPTKKVKPYNKHPNDIEKSSLTRGGASAASVSSCAVSATLLLLWFAMR